MNAKSFVKTGLVTIVLMALLITPYLLTKKERDFNPFTLELKTDSNPVTLKSLQKKYKYIFLYFGFLSCPDVCPTTLSKMAVVFKALPTELREQVALVFIDLDPERDKIEDLRNYTSFFDASTIPVSLNLQELDLFTRYFGIVFMKIPLKSEMGYTIDHSTDIVVLNSEGKILPAIFHSSPTVAVIAQIKDLFKKENL